MIVDTPTQVHATADDIAARLFNASIETFDLVSVYLGEKLGFYRSLAADGPATSGELAARTGTAERYVREWLEQQAVTGFLGCAEVSAAPEERRYHLPAGYEAVFTDPDSPAIMTPLTQAVVGALFPLPALLEAYRTGAGVPFEQYGVDLHEGQAGVTRPLFVNFLAREWIPAMKDVHARLLADPPARIADVGMGHGRSSLALAEAYPKILVDGFDLDEASVKAARANASAAGLAERVRFHHRDAGDPDLAGEYDFALAVECIHDMSDPVATLRSMRRLVGDGGTVLVIDEKVADTFTAPGDEVERWMYGFSILHCLAVSLVDQPSAATGTVIRSDTMRRYATGAGYTSVEVVPIEHDFWRFYRLTG